MRAHIVVAVLGGAALAACGGHDAPTTPTPSAPQLSTVAKNYVTQALDWEQQVSYYTKKINWATARPDVFAKAGSAQTPAETYPAINYSIEHYLRPLGDPHSAFFPPSIAPGRADNPPNDVRYAITGTAIAPNIAYMAVPSFTGKNPPGHADSTVALIKQLDAAKPCGWILDLRANYGGYVGSMFAGLSPLMAQGTFGGMADADNAQALFYVDGPEMGYIDPSQNNRRYVDTRGTATYTLSRPNAPVALLQGPFTASAAELILLSYKGSSVPSRTFGSSSYGLTTSPLGTYLAPDSGYLNITYAIWFDRTGTLYGKPIVADSVIPQSTQFSEYSQVIGAKDPAVNAAIAWLQSRPECKSGAALAQRAPLPREVAGPSAVRLPYAVAPRTRPFIPPKVFARPRP